MTLQINTQGTGEIRFTKGIGLPTERGNILQSRRKFLWDAARPPKARDP